jgi:hypothetical protein
LPPLTLKKGEIFVELEQRVKTLEYEMKILKNEIQRTLLDIQEQILVHYYPSLRREDDTPSEGIVQTFESLQGKKVPTEETSPPPQAKKISLEEVQAMEEEEASPPPEAEMSQDDLMHLSAWVSKAVKQMGGERTRKLIQAYTEKGFATPRVEGFLLKLTAMSNDETPPEKVEMKETLSILLELNKLLGLEANVETALSLIEEADLG